MEIKVEVEAIKEIVRMLRCMDSIIRGEWPEEHWKVTEEEEVERVIKNVKANLPKE